MFLLPRITPGEDVLDKFYHLYSILQPFMKVHPLAKNIEMKMIKHTDIDSIYEQTSTPETFLIVKEYIEKRLYHKRAEDHLDDLQLVSYELEDTFKKQRELAKEINGKIVNTNAFDTEVHQYITLMRELNSHVKNYDLLLPIPYVCQQQGLFLIDEVIGTIKNNKIWLKDIIHFFEFLTESNFIIEEPILPSDFLFTKDGKVDLFIGFNKLNHSTKPKRDRLFINLEQFKIFMNEYANYYYQNNYKSDQHELGRIFSKVNHSHSSYINFKEILADIDHTLVKAKDIRKVGIFIDYANLFTSVDPLKIGVEVLFTKLLFMLYEDNPFVKFTIKYASVFQPVKNNEKQDEKRVADIKSYLIKDNIETNVVSNGFEKAKTIINGEEFDVDDLDLIQKMKQNLQVLDEIILFSGDKHFIEIVKEYRSLDRKVMIVSVSGTTSVDLKSLADEYHCISEYSDCIKYKFEERINWIS